MTSAAPPGRPIWPTRWSAALRDRLQYFRLLTLLLALVALWGVVAAFGINAAWPAATVLTIGSAFLLSVVWTRGIRRREYSSRWLAAEAVLFLGYSYGLGFGPFGAMYVALQHRALFGRRRDAVMTACAYAAVLVFAQLALPNGLRGMGRGIIALELACGAFAAYLMHTLAEILDRDQARTRALRESEQRFRSVIENMREALVITDLDDRITLANQRVRDVLGYAPEELVGRPVTDLVADGEMRAAFRDRLETRKNGLSELYEAELLHQDGHVIQAEISAAPYRDAGGDIVGSQGAITDISARKRLQARLRHTTRMEAIGQLAGGVAHDFNNLLTVIKVHTGLLQDELAPADPHRDNVTEIERSADRAASLTKQLLAFSRKQLLQPRRIQLADVIDGCDALLRKLVDDEVTLRIAHDPTDATVYADPREVEQILVALVRNANDALTDAPRGTIEVRTARAQMIATSLASGPEMPAGQYMCLTISDTGRGIPARLVPHVFEPFVTTKEPGHGTGLGLASVYGAVRQSGGYVTVESTPGAGTTFRIYFPIVASGAERQVDRAPRASFVG